MYMPKQTFLNLTEERQAEILQVAYREFTMNDYQAASLSRVIKTLKLAKGSFYRYFSSKKELYFYLLEVATEKRYRKLNERIKEYSNDLFELLIINWRDKIKFEREHPLESGFIYRMMRERHNNEIGDLDLNNKRMVSEKVKEMIVTQYSAGIRDDIDLDLISFLIVQVQMGFYDYLAIKYDDDLMTNLREGKNIYTLNNESMESIIQSFTSLLKEGISKKDKA